MITVYEDSKPVRADELQPGDVVWDSHSGQHGNWRTVAHVGPAGDDGYIWIRKANRNRAVHYPNDFKFSVATGTPSFYATYEEWVKETCDADAAG